VPSRTQYHQVTGDPAAEGLAQQRRQAGGAAPGVNLEVGHVGLHRGPQPAQAAAQLPTGLVGVLVRRRRPRGGFGMGRSQCRAHLLLRGRHRAQADGHPEERLRYFLDVALAVVAGAAEVGEGAGQARPQGVGADVGRDGRVVERAALRAGAEVPLMLGDLDQYRRQFGDLMPTGFGVVRAALHRQGRLATRAGLGAMMDRADDAFGRQADALAGGMAGLGPGLAAGRLPHHLLGRGDGIGRRRHGRVGRVLAEPGLQFAHGGAEVGHLALQSRDTSVALLITGTRRHGLCLQLTASSGPQLRQSAEKRVNDYHSCLRGWAPNGFAGSRVPELVVLFSSALWDVDGPRELELPLESDDADITLLTARINGRG
jgi:hypothetical protein